MRIGELSRAVQAIWTAGEAPIIYGAPGVGKSDAVREAAGAAGRAVIDVRTTLLDAVDLRGLPYLDDSAAVKKLTGGRGVARWSFPEFLPLPGCGPVVVFLDELPNAAQSVQSALLQPVLDHRIGDWIEPADGGDSVVWCAAGNRVEDRAGSAKIISSLADRFIRLDAEVSTDDWVSWALDHDIATEVVAFIRFRPESLSAPDPRLNVTPSPRSWAKVSAMLPHLDGSIMLPVIGGAVGEGAAGEFLAFLEMMRHLPDLDALLLDPARAKLPKENQISALIAVASGIARRACEDHAEAIIQIARRLPTEFGVMAMRDAVRRDQAGMTGNRAFQIWASENGEALMA